MFERQGAVFFQIVDLDAVFGSGDNTAIIESLAGHQVPCQVGGGIRSCERAVQLLELGVDRVICGTLFHRHMDEAEDLVKRFGRRIVAALDVQNGEVLIEGRQHGLGLNIQDTVDRLRNAGVQEIVYSHVVHEQEFSKPDVEEIRRVIAACEGMQVFANVGVRSDEDLETMRGLTEEGLIGTVVDHALYDDSASLKAAF